jgi:MarR family transcriptional regulator for hemolysin
MGSRSTQLQPLDAPPWRRVESTLMATSRAIRRAFDARLADLSLNLTESSLLVYVQESGSLTQTQLADRLAIGRAATGAVIDALERRRLLERRPDPADRRVWLVAATPGGKELAARVIEVDRGLRAELRAGISREERQQLARLLVRLQENAAGVLEP